MSTIDFGLCLLCALALSIGQILFKLASRQPEEQSLTGTFLVGAWKKEDVILVQSVIGNLFSSRRAC